MSKPVLVLKFGTASITKPTGEPNEPVMVDIARQVAALHPHYRIVLVSSGAVGAGKALIHDYKGDIIQRKAAAAIGNLLLLNQYSRFFAIYGISIAQSLCERHHFANRDQFLQLKQTYEELWANELIPIANENDVVSNRELKFSDNDELATLIAAGFGAKVLMLCTSVGGLLDNNGQIIRKVTAFDEQVFSVVRTDKSSLGLGGMASKLTFAKLATRMGIRVVIFGMNEPDSLGRALRGETGTEFVPQANTLSARNRWLGSGSLAVGQIQVDAGAVRALKQRRSLLAVGVRAIPGEFATGEMVEILDENQETVAVARTRISSETLAQQLNQQNVEVANANDIVLL
ncbi:MULTISPECIES: glutamate 5-kinase [unclassified Spirosoma]|uniref:glutamate 5-kinase n=1 Tax=unclassified Spirosoma TaxID=2621999 RepID=UPI000962114C|nr:MULTISPECIES: glutamate 5-kinase [unclassified Spirosoma]MBN8823852.1 glutamate 5-kinase [Spirosoma sp.]OJW79756.1 MAG: glutamate 5-kinase [Spirosoma sp. 48-14]